MAEDGHFASRTAQEPPGERGTIDSFFASVAQDSEHGGQERQIAGVVLSGTDGDGTLGITAIKEAGGLTLAEESGEIAQDGGAPNHNPSAACRSYRQKPSMLI